jgi:hypothetical protein
MHPAEIVAILVAIVGVIIPVIIPEARRYFGLQDDSNPSQPRKLRILAALGVIAAVVVIVLLVGHSAEEASRSPTSEASPAEHKDPEPASSSKPQEPTPLERPTQQPAPILYGGLVCSFSGESENGGPGHPGLPWKKTESCNIPSASHLDANYHQGDFKCCGGGAMSKTTSIDVPPGLELRNSGSAQWAVRNPVLKDSVLSVETYCKPDENIYGTCSVRVEVYTHYP